LPPMKNAPDTVPVLYFGDYTANKCNHRSYTL
jgi:hypothetical protein